MPRTFMTRHLEEKQRLKFDPKTGEVSVAEPVVVDGTIPPLPELPPPGGPEGMEAWDRDWTAITTLVKHGPLLRDVLTAIVAEHKAEGPVIELSTKPRARAAQIVEIMEPWRNKYTPIFEAIRAWLQTLTGLRRFHAGGPDVGGAVSNAIRALNRPLHALSSLPPVPEVDPDDLRSLEAALGDLIRQANEAAERAKDADAARQAAREAAEAATQAEAAVTEVAARIAGDESALREAFGAWLDALDDPTAIAEIKRRVKAMKLA